MPEPSSWQKQRDEMLEQVSRKHGAAARTAFVRIRDRELDHLRGERKTKRQVLDACRRAFEKLSAAYHRHEGTTYGGWIEHGPKREWDELVAAAADDAVWDRLVETVDQREVER